MFTLNPPRFISNPTSPTESEGPLDQADELACKQASQRSNALDVRVNPEAAGYLQWRHCSDYHGLSSCLDKGSNRARYLLRLISDIYRSSTLVRNREAPT